MVAAAPAAFNPLAQIQTAQQFAAASVTPAAGTAAAGTGALSGLGAAAAAAAGPIALAITAYTLIDSILAGSKEKQRIKDSRIVDLGVLGSSGQQLGVGIGRFSCTPLAAYAALNDDIPKIGRAGSEGVKRVFGTLGLKDDKARDKSLLMQHAYSVGECEGLTAVKINGKVLGAPPTDSGIQSFKSDVARIEDMEYETASQTAKAFTGSSAVDPGGTGTMERDDDSLFLEKSYFTALFFGTTDVKEEVVYSGDAYPQLEVFGKGIKIRTFDEDGNLSHEASYSNNVAELIFWYLNNDTCGPKRDGAIQGDQDFDIPSFARAAKLCAFRTRNVNSQITDVDVSDDQACRQVGVENWEAMTQDQRRALKTALTTASTLNFRGNVFGSGISPINGGVARTGFFPSTDFNLIKHEWNGYLNTDETWEDTWELLGQPIPGLQLYKNISNDKIGINVPDWMTPTDEQVKRTFTNDDVISAGVRVDRPDKSSSLVNQVTLRIRNQERYGEEDTITFPSDDSHWLDQLIQQDGGKFVQEVTPAGLDNEYAGKAWAATRVLMSHRNTYSWVADYWDDPALDVSPGDVVRLKIDGLQVIDRPVRLTKVDLDREDGRWVVRLAGIHFVRSDYEYQIDDDEPIKDLNAFHTALDPLTGISADGGSGELTVTLQDNDANVLTNAYEIQIKPTGGTWEDDKDEWFTLLSPTILTHSQPTKAGTWNVRARKRSLYGGGSEWLEMAGSVTVKRSAASGVQPHTVDKGTDYLTIGMAQPADAPDSYRVTLALDSDPDNVLKTNEVNDDNGFVTTFDGLKPGTRYLIRVVQIKDGADVNEDLLRSTTDVAEGFTVIPTGKSTLQATVPDQGDGYVYEWEYDLGRLGQSNDQWIPAGTSTTNTHEITGNIRGNQIVNVHARWRKQGAAQVGGSWVDVGSAQTHQDEDAPGHSTGLSMTILTDGRFKLDWTLPTGSRYPLARTGLRVIKDGTVVAFIGEEDAITTKTTKKMNQEGNYFFEVVAISEDARGNRYYGDPIRSDVTYWEGADFASIDDTDLDVT